MTDQDYKEELAAKILGCGLDYWVLYSTIDSLANALQERIKDSDQRIVRPDKRLIKNARATIEEFRKKAEQIGKIYREDAKAWCDKNKFNPERELFSFEEALNSFKPSPDTTQPPTHVDPVRVEALGTAISKALSFHFAQFPLSRPRFGEAFQALAVNCASVINSAISFTDNSSALNLFSSILNHYLKSSPPQNRSRRRPSHNHQGNAERELKSSTARRIR